MSDGASSGPGSQGFAPEPQASQPIGADPSRGTCYCSFCGKSQHDVLKLIAGPAVWICDECVHLCQDIVATAPGAKPQSVGMPFNELAKRLGVFTTEYGIKDGGSLALVASMCWALGCEPSVQMRPRDSDRSPEGGDA
jgi:hypothetical protein